jgi:hypothetical protein
MKYTPEQEAVLIAINMAIKQAENELVGAKSRREEFLEDPRNNRFDTLEDAEGTLYETLRDRASTDCEGSYNCGSDEYSQRFYVGDQLYVAVAQVEYNRHDKQYYYVDDYSFVVQEVSA